MRCRHHFALGIVAIVFIVFAYSFWINAAQ